MKIRSDIFRYGSHRTYWRYNEKSTFGWILIKFRLEICYLLEQKFQICRKVIMIFIKQSITINILIIIICTWLLRVSYSTFFKQSCGINSSSICAIYNNIPIVWIFWCVLDLIICKELWFFLRQIWLDCNFAIFSSVHSSS